MDVQQTINALEWWLSNNKQKHCEVLDGNLKVAIMSAVDNLKSSCVKHGHWIEMDDGVIDYNTGEIYKTYQCSKCGEQFEMREGEQTMYCCECGAKMDEVSE